MKMGYSILIPIVRFAPVYFQSEQIRFHDRRHLEGAARPAAVQAGEVNKCVVGKTRICHNIIHIEYVPRLAQFGDF